MAEERKNDPREGLKEGLKAGFGILGALKEALEETFEEAMKERDFGPDKARDAFKDTMRRAQSAMDEAKDRFDFVPRREFDALRAQVDAMRHQLENHLTAAVHHSHGPLGDVEPQRAAGETGGADAFAPTVQEAPDRDVHSHSGTVHSHPGGRMPHEHAAGGPSQESAGTVPSSPGAQGGGSRMPDGGFGAGSGPGGRAGNTGGTSGVGGIGGPGTSGFEAGGPEAGRAGAQSFADPGRPAPDSPPRQGEAGDRPFPFDETE